VAPNNWAQEKEHEPKRPIKSDPMNGTAPPPPTKRNKKLFLLSTSTSIENAPKNPIRTPNKKIEQDNKTIFLVPSEQYSNPAIPQSLQDGRNYQPPEVRTGLSSDEVV